MPERVAVVGAGIVGLANAWREAVHGARVTLFERDERAVGASVRNFGMVWPIGQPIDHLETALLSRSLWKEFLEHTRAWGAESGSLHVARREDEWRVLEEFSDANQEAYGCQLLTPEAAAERCSAIDSPELLGAMWSPNEIGVDPREVISKGPKWLAEAYEVQPEFGTQVTNVSPPVLSTADGRHWDFDRVVIASGADFATLFPEVFAEVGLAKCKLQMMRTSPQPRGWRLGPMLASGLTLRHYATFAECPGLADLRRRIAEETPELDHYGIHVMAAQNELGEVVLGDSHEYGSDIEPFDKAEVTRLMLRELRGLLDIPTWELAAQWHGVYAIQPNHGPQFVAQPLDGVTIVIATGGSGMTMSFGLAEQRIAGSPSTTRSGEPKVSFSQSS